MAGKVAVGSSSLKISYPPGCKEINEELTKDELVRRLKLLARAFQDMVQDENNEYKHLALYLASEFFLDHSSKDAKLLVACCIADIFRIFAPEAPYTDNEHLKEIFLFLTQQLRGLEDPDSPSFKRYFYLLENLAWVKSFNICIEMDDNQEIFCSLYKLMFTIVNSKHSNKVINFMLDMMCPLITEADSVSQELLDIILVNIIEPHKTQKSHAYNLAKDLIRRTANAIEPYIQTFFNNALMLGKTSESEVSGRLYDLIYELNSISPSVLLAVLPQLEFKLKTSEDSERKGVTQLLAKMFSDADSDLALQNKPLWLCFLGRFNDIDISVRRICVQASADFIVNHRELVRDIEEPLKQRQHDPDENVRMDVVQAIVGASRRELPHVTDSLMEAVKERTLDKKFKIRKEALNGLGQIYKKSMLREDVDKQEAKRVSWIRNKVLYAYYQTNLDDRLLVERIMNLALVPYNLDPKERMHRLFVLYGNIDDHAVKALQEIFKIQTNLRNLLRSLLELHNKASDNPDVQQLIKQRVVQISRQLPEPSKAAEHIRKLNKLISDDQRVRGILVKLVAPDCTCKKAEECVKEVLKKTGNPIPQNTLYTTVKALLERVAPVMIDCHAVTALIKYIEDAVTGLGEINDDVPHAVEKGMKLLLILSLTYPGSFQNEEVYTQLMGFVKNDDDTVSDYTMQLFTNIGARLEHTFPNIYSSLLPVLQKLVKIGTPQQAKHAIRCIAAICRNKSAIFVQIFEHLKKNMELDSPNFLTSLVGIGHMAELCPGEFAAPVKGIVSKFIVKELLMQDRGMRQHTADSWYSDHLVSEETQAKVQSLKMMVRWLLGLKTNASNSGTSTLRLLHTLMLHEGDLMESGQINKAEMARLRLQAGCCMLKLAQEQCYESLITLEQFQATALLLNDPCYQVRVQFAQKLHKGLLSLRLPLSYMAVFCLVANDPLKERRTHVKQFLMANINKRREYLKQNQPVKKKLFQILPEYVLPYAIHLLAHDPDLQDNTDSDTLKNVKECLWFVMEPLITKNDNYSYSFYRKMIENIKQTKDAQCPDSEVANFKLYAVCDLALSLVMTKTTSFVLKDFPAEPVLPAKLFTQADQNYTNVKNYLPADLLILGTKPKKPLVPGLSPVAPPVARDVPIARQSAVVLHASDKKPPSSPSDLATSPENSEGEEEEEEEGMDEDEDVKVKTTKVTVTGAKRKLAAPKTNGTKKPAPKRATAAATTSSSTAAVAGTTLGKRSRRAPRRLREEEDDEEQEEEEEEEEKEEEEEAYEQEVNSPPPAKKARGTSAGAATASATSKRRTSAGTATQGKITDFVSRSSKRGGGGGGAAGDSSKKEQTAANTDNNNSKVVGEEGGGGGGEEDGGRGTRQSRRAIATTASPEASPVKRSNRAASNRSSASSPESSVSSPRKKPATTRGNVRMASSKLVNGASQEENKRPTATRRGASPAATSSSAASTPDHSQSSRGRIGTRKSRR